MGPISTGLGEIYWWAWSMPSRRRFCPFARRQPGWQSDGSYLTPEGDRLTDDFQRTVYLRTVQDWIIRPQMKTVPACRGRRIGGFVSSSGCSPIRPAHRLRAVVQPSRLRD